jgi:hypothetical protein
MLTRSIAGYACLVLERKDDFKITFTFVLACTTKNTQPISRRLRKYGQMN